MTLTAVEPPVGRAWAVRLVPWQMLGEHSRVNPEVHPIVQRGIENVQGREYAGKACRRCKEGAWKAQGRQREGA